MGGEEPLCGVSQANLDFGCAIMNKRAFFAFLFFSAS